MENILDKLNQEQLEAVKEVRGAVLVLAGAGSGKTRVLTSRIAYMIKSGIKPKDILAVTFTNKAAKEMRERLSDMLGENTTKYMWVGTFHSICGRILRQDLENYETNEGRKFDNNFTIYDEQDSVNLIKQILKKRNIDDKKFAPKTIKSIISNAKNKMMDSNNLARFARDYYTQVAADVYEDYEQALLNNNAIDFDDMLLLCVKLFENHPNIRQKYYDKFKHILIDEFQDTNLAQYKLVKMLYTNGIEDYDKDRSLCVVGDIDQSIYSWRGADYKILLNFKSDFKDAQMIKLEQNYRSTANILNCANAIIENNEERVDKILRSTKGEGEKIKIFEAQDESDEANYIARKIKDLTYNYNECAVLYRTNAQSRAIEEALITAGIPYKIYGGLKFYDRKEIKDIIAYLKLIHNHNDSVSFRRIINTPKRSIGDSTIEKLQNLAYENNLSLFEAISIIDESTIQTKTKQKLKDFAELIKKLEEAQNKYVLDEYVGLVIEKSGYAKELTASQSLEDETRLDNLQELVNVASDFEPEEENNRLGEFLAQVALVSDIDNLETVSNNVTLMTLHSAKGLEFPYVFIAGLEDGMFPSARCSNSLTELEEERRLMYVGVTRAQEDLFITYAKRRLQWGDYKYNPPSRFLEEIPSKLVDSNTSTSPISKHTFKSAIETVATRFNEDGRINTVTSFGKNFVAPSKRTYTSGADKILKPKKFVSKEQEEKSIKEFLQNNVIKQQIIERDKKRQEEQQRLEKEKAERNNITILKEGDRVFHEKLGIGKILEVIEVGESTMYSVDFGRNGKKALDASYANLKKF